MGSSHPFNYISGFQSDTSRLSRIVRGRSTQAAGGHENTNDSIDGSNGPCETGTA